MLSRSSDSNELTEALIDQSDMFFPEEVVEPEKTHTVLPDKRKSRNIAARLFEKELFA